MDVTVQIASILLTIAVVGLGCLRWLARDFDRTYGKNAETPPAE